LGGQLFCLSDLTSTALALFQLNLSFLFWRDQFPQRNEFCIPQVIGSDPLQKLNLNDLLRLEPEGLP